MNLEVQKEKIKDFIEVNGPSLPVHISGHLRLNSLLASAFLADLLSEKELKISNLRVGNSPLYFIRGQEFQLEKYANYLPGKEREAFYLLKEHGVLQDRFMLPPIRVALRAIKDFAFPFEYNDDLYWRFIKTNEEDAIKMIENGGVNFSQIPRFYQTNHKPVGEQTIETQKNLTEKAQEIKEEIIKEEPKRIEFIEPVKKEIIVKEPEIIEKQVEIKEESPEKIIEPIFEKPIEEIKEVLKEEVKVPIVHKIVRKVKVKEKPVFVVNILSVLQNENFIVVENEKFKKKDYSAIVSSDNKKYLCLAKDKKVISESDIMAAVKSGQKLKLPVIFVGNGEPNKKALDWLEYFEKLIVYKKFESE
jgi:hypothetical protein